MKRNRALALSLMLMTFVGLMPLAAGAKGNEARTAYGKPLAFAGADIKTYLTLDKNRAPVALGVEIPASALAKLPETLSDMVIALPQEAQSLTPFRYLGMEWNPQGHEPDKIYTMPHFDFHFYIQSLEERNSIDPGSCQGVDCADFERATKDVPAAYLPRDYRSVGAVVPRMGNHLIDPASPEFNNQPFTRTFLYGAYDGRITFYEPMLTLQYLQSQPNEYLDLKLPAAYAQTGYYPTRYSVRYDPSKEVYRISLERFVYHVAR
ncbi:MAG TPA: DUF5602 domain-containing protein [Pyrinomonadaceae bacterium]|jgi:hypothetical protein